MAEDEIEEKTTNSNDFDIDTELNILVENKVIPKVIADKLSNKIKEKNINISKEQLIALAEKLNEFIKTYQDRIKKQDVEKGNQKQVPIEEAETEKTIKNQNFQELCNKINILQKQIDVLSNNSESSLEEVNQLINQKEECIKNKHIKQQSVDDLEVSGNHLDVSMIKNDDILTELPSDPEGIIVLMNWIQYLIDLCGYENLSNILEYYVDIDWITDDVKISLIDYSRGIKQKKSSETSKNTDEKDVNQLSSTYHIQSYMFIQKLMGNKFDKHFVDRVQSELIRIIKKVDQFQQVESNQ